MNEVFSLGRCLWIPNSKFHLEVLVLYIVHCPLARGVAVSINTAYKIGCCNWTLIQLCTEVVFIILNILLLWLLSLLSLLLSLSLLCNVLTSPVGHITLSFILQLMYYIYCWFRISYLSIPGIAAHSRCNISHIFIFSFVFSYRGIFL